MKLLIFDTETTGLPKTRLPATRGPNNWPHIVSIAWIVMDNETKIKERYAIIKPKWDIPADSTKIHGITQENAEENGEDLGKVISEFLSENPDRMIAHNMNFDFNVLINAILWDLNLSFPVVPKQFCTMETMRNVCKLPSQLKDYKSPKLSELYEFVFQKKPDQQKLHNSLYDVQVLTDIIYNCNILKSMIGLPVVKEETSNESSAKRSKILHL